MNANGRVNDIKNASLPSMAHTLNIAPCRLAEHPHGVRFPATDEAPRSMSDVVSTSPEIQFQQPHDKRRTTTVPQRICKSSLQIRCGMNLPTLSYGISPETLKKLYAPTPKPHSDQCLRRSNLSPRFKFRTAFATLQIRSGNSKARFFLRRSSIYFARQEVQSPRGQDHPQAKRCDE